MTRHTPPPDLPAASPEDAAVLASAGPPDTPAATRAAERMRRLDALMTRAANGSRTAEGVLLHDVAHAMEAIVAMAARHGHTGAGPARYALFHAIARTFPRMPIAEIRAVVLEFIPDQKRAG
jgi:hypothetical protein